MESAAAIAGRVKPNATGTGRRLCILRRVVVCCWALTALIGPREVVLGAG